MLLIKNNPYRILGISLFDSEKEIQKKITKITRFTEVGKDVSFDYDLTNLIKIDRGLQNINNSKRKIENPLNKVLHSLFWFYQSNHIDEIGLESLVTGDIDKTFQLWKKVVKEGDVISKNFSTLSNLKTLMYLRYNLNGFDKNTFKEFLELTGKFFSNKEFEDYSKKIVNTSKTNISYLEITTAFLDEILNEIRPLIDKKNGISYPEIINSLKFFSSELKDHIISKITSNSVNFLETRIKETDDLRNENPINGVQLGKTLYGDSKDELKQLENILGSDDVKYQILADKLSNEILQCAIDYFNKKDNCDQEDGHDILELVGYASKFSNGDQVKSRIKENEDYIKKWLDDAPDREKFSEISQDYNFIQDILTGPIELLNNGDVTEKMKLIDSCESIISESKVRLDNIKIKLGEHDDLYIKISSEVVQVVIALMVEYVNTTSSVIGIELRSISVFKSLTHFRMDSSTRERFEKNSSTLNRLYAQSDRSAEGCYIATMVYGDYDDPNVLVLRSFRDKILKKTFLGREFIYFYYKISPHLVNRFKDLKLINNAIKKTLDTFILILKKYE